MNGTAAASQEEIIVKNSEPFLAGLPANNVLLWGSRGTGKSSLVKALLDRLLGHPGGKEDLVYLSEMFSASEDQPYRFIYALRRSDLRGW